MSPAARSSRAETKLPTLGRAWRRPALCKRNRGPEVAPLPAEPGRFARPHRGGFRSAGQYKAFQGPDYIAGRTLLALWSAQEDRPADVPRISPQSRARDKTFLRTGKSPASRERTCARARCGAVSTPRAAG